LSSEEDIFSDGLIAKTPLVLDITVGASSPAMPGDGTSKTGKAVLQ